MNIGLLDHMGYGNLGDAAIQDVVIANIKKRVPGARMFAFSIIPTDTVARHGIPTYPLSWFIPEIHNGELTDGKNEPRSNLARLKSILKKSAIVYRCLKPIVNFGREIAFCVRSYRTLRKLDLLIISGGGQIDELWHGPWGQPYTLFKFSLLTKAARKKLYFLNVGAGPLRHPLSRFFAKWAVRLADYRSFRDRDSQERVQKLGVKAATQVFPDAVYALDVKEALNGHAVHRSRPVVGINPTAFCDPRLWPRKAASIYMDYIAKLVQFSMWLVDQGFTVRLFSTDIVNDRLAMEDIKAGILSKSSSPDLAIDVLLDASSSVKDALQAMSDFDFVITCKYHGIIFSHLLGKPVISLNYQKKMDVAMCDVGQGCFSADVEHFTLDWLLDRFRLLVAESKNISSGAAFAVSANASKLSQQFDSLFLPEKPQLS